MVTNAKWTGRWIFIAVAIGLFCSAESLAKKPPAPPPDDSASCALVTLDDRDGSVRGNVTDLKIVNGIITCVGFVGETDGDQAVVWQVAPSESGYDVTTSYLAEGEFAAAINADGEVVGECRAFDADTQLWLFRGLYWPSAGEASRALGPLPGDNETQPLGINAAGVIVGRSTYKYATYDDNGSVTDVFEEPTAVGWRTDVMDDNGDLVPFVLGNASGNFSAAHDVNECDGAGVAQVVGITEDGPAMWVVDCLTLASTGPARLVPENMTASGPAEGINNAGDACGRNGSLAFRSLADGTYQNLSVPRGATSTANDINNQRLVVGRVWEWTNKGGLSKTYGAMWQADGTRVDLNTFLGNSAWRYIHEGMAIDASGIIAAKGALNADGESCALLMIPK